MASNYYVPGLGLVRFLAPRDLPLSPKSDAVKGWVYHVHLRRPSPNASRDLTRWFSRSRCSHTYDCCGCAFWEASARRLGPRRFSVTVRAFLNI